MAERGDDAFSARRDELLAEVRRCGSATCAELAATLGWSSHETRAKLVSLQKAGLVYYDASEWHEETEQGR